MSIVIRSVLLYGQGTPVDVVVDQGIITDIGSTISPPPGAQLIDADQHILLPGFVDLHTHLREPGREYAEDIQSGSQAAALGGYTAICAMPNTTPVADCAAITDYVFTRGQQVGLVDVYPIGAITVGLQGQQLAEMATMASSTAQVRMFSDDGHCVGDPQLMRRALEYSVGLNAIIAQHAEETRLTAGAVAHDGPTAARLGLTGWPRSAEESIVARDILLAKETHARLHICHASTAGTAELIHWAKQQGVRISAEVAPHHLFLDDSVLDTYDGVNRVNPPLREKTDTAALQTALAQGIIDCVATDHAPHADYEKNCEFDRARPGMLGLQTALSIIIKTMVLSNMMTWRDLARVMSEKPAQILGLSDQGRPLEIGEPANLVVVNPHTQWVVDSTKLASKSRNTPYEGMTLPGSITATLLRGRLTTYQGQCTQ